MQAPNGLSYCNPKIEVPAATVARRFSSRFSSDVVVERVDKIDNETRLQAWWSNCDAVGFGLEGG